MIKKTEIALFKPSLYFCNGVKTPKTDRRGRRSLQRNSSHFAPSPKPPSGREVDFAKQKTEGARARFCTIFALASHNLHRRGDHRVKSKIVNKVCNNIVYTFWAGKSAFGNRTERSGGRFPNAARWSCETTNTAVEPFSGRGIYFGNLEIAVANDEAIALYRANLQADIRHCFT